MTDAVPETSGSTRRPGRARQWPLFIAWVLSLALVLFLQGAGAGGEAAATLDAAPATLLAPRTARVLQVLVKPGDVVSKGMRVVELDAAELELEIAVGTAELEKLRTEVSARSLEVQGSDFESGTRLELEAERASVDLATLVGDEKRDHAELDALDAQIEKQRELVEKKLASAEQRDQLVLRRAAVAERVAEAAAAIATARAHDASAKSRLTQWKSTHKVNDDDRTAPERAAVRAQEERLNQLQQRRAALTLKAPVDGVVADVLVGVGATVKEGDAAIVLMDTQVSRATAWVDEGASSQVRVGDRVTLTPADGRGSARTGKVRALGAGVVEIPRRFWQLSSEPTFGRAVFVDLDAIKEPAVPGQRYQARFGGAA